ncbi:hypothetical protein CCR97_08015 [Rhodoplanes elegans]|uniref:Uncharacterized protein n=1 Tax=Rhodoplanes elegans TaxID=29408 RepID=A0A327KRX4_9BRAD|nr:hypothetical protein [Rhodoplanes elegans]MBK5958064.1 hypothetical protein [Rhodoplanes elegans]MBK5958156.1 hypothetical protein [Rhodoplanes elegans]RAI40443.1 hypothetical protein CH338_06265 [Rhodoplanes elegans]
MSNLSPHYDELVRIVSDLLSNRRVGVDNAEVVAKEAIDAIESAGFLLAKTPDRTDWADKIFVAIPKRW